MEKNKDVRIPVTVLTGFLGAGKTTFLNHLLKKNEGTRYAVIENEFGQEGIDNELILRPTDTIVELNNGCLCCTLNDNLYDILNELFDRRDEFDEIVIEATGVADPAGLAQPFIAHPLIKKHFPLKAIICLVDAEIVEDQLHETEEALNQITFSDVLLINKTDLVSEKYVTVLKDKLRELNPLATIVEKQNNQFPKIEYDRILEKLEKVNIHPVKEGELDAKSSSLPFHKPYGHHHHHHKHTEDINSQTFVFDVPFDFQSLYQQLFVYLAFQSKDLYRMKGLVWLESENQQFVFQSVGKRLDFKAQRPWNPSEEKRSVLVFIGKNLKREGLEKMLNRCFSANAKEIKKAKL